VVEFCRKEGVSAVSFYRWRKRLAQRPGPAEEVTGFRAVRVVGTNGTLVAAGVAVQLPGGTQLRVPTSDPEGLRLVNATLARADARRAGGRPC